MSSGVGWRDALSGSGRWGDEQMVAVNQRHLIDKILARYSTEHTLFREMAQNADDAGAGRLVVEFRTVADQDDEEPGAKLPQQQASSSSRWGLLNYILKQAMPSAFQASSAEQPAVMCDHVSIRNDGAPFSDQDWRRVKSIAEGNPDESKVGFFGVGFYSVFSLTESPAIKSGSQAIVFRWKGDQLSWTTVDVPYRTPQPVPQEAQFTGFLAHCLCFTRHMSSITMKVDGQDRITMRRTGQLSPIDIPKSMQSMPLRLFTVTSIAVGEKAFDLDLPQHDHVGLIHVTAHLEVTVPAALSNAIMRITKKLPAKNVGIQLLLPAGDYSGHLLKEVAPVTPGAGRVFIGFVTHQSTGSSCHVSAPLIPTVERETIDLADRVLAAWNRDLLFSCGQVQRVVHDWRCRSGQPADAATSMASMARTATSPLADVGKLLSYGFFSFSSAPLVWTVQRGPVPANQARLPHLGIEAHIAQDSRSTAVVPPEHWPTDGLGKLIADTAVPASIDKFLDELLQRGLLQRLSLDDLRNDVRDRQLEVDELVALLKWLFKLHSKTNGRGALTRQQRDVLNAIQLRIPKIMSQEGPTTDDAVGHAVVSVSSFENFSLLKAFLSGPERFRMKATLPSFVACEFSARDLGLWLPALSPVAFVKHAAQVCENDGTNRGADGFVDVLAQCWTSMTPEQRAETTAALATMHCIPSSINILLPPTDLYIDERATGGFADLPTVAGGIVGTTGAVRRILLHIGVRDHINPAVIFERFDDIAWPAHQLIGYLTRMQSQLSPDELSRLQATRFLPAQLQDPKRFFAPAELVVPWNRSIVDVGSPKIPVAAFSEAVNETSNEGRFLVRLGMRQHPSLAVLLSALSDVSLAPKQRDHGITYLLDNLTGAYARRSSTSEDAFDLANPATRVKFLPTADSTATDVVAAPLECFESPAAALLGFPVLHERWTQHARRLLVPEAPPSHAILLALREAKFDRAHADQIFCFLWAMFEKRRFSAADLKTISSLPIIPVENTQELQLAHKVYLAPTDNDDQTFGRFSSLFTYVRFSPMASAFLREIGVRDSPTANQLALKIAANATVGARQLETLGPDQYLQLLRFLAVQWDQLHGDVRVRMASTPCLLGISPSGASDGRTTYVVANAGKIVLIDNTMLAESFETLSAPRDDLLESLYENLGSQWLSHAVTEQCEPGSIIANANDMADELLQRIKERLPVILYRKKDLELRPLAVRLGDELEVVIVATIQRRLTFRSLVKALPTTACFASSKISLFVTPKFDFFDIGTALSGFIFQKSTMADSLLCATILEASLQSLRAKGFPVDRLIAKRPDMPGRRQAPAPTAGQESERSMTSQAPNETQPSDDVTRSQDAGRRQLNPFRKLKKLLKASEQVPSEAVPAPPTTTQINRKFMSFQDEVDRFLGGLRRNTPLDASIAESIPFREGCPEPSQPINLVLAPGVTFSNLPVYCHPDQSGHLLRPDVQDCAGDLAQIVIALAAGVFDLERLTMTLFWDSSSRLIAFNRNGAISFNIVQHFSLSPYDGDRRTPFVYWLGVMVHELAHNAVGPHNKEFADACNTLWQHFFRRATTFIDAIR
ncbi:unnamed protein product (mitochondrion) [Plasmodiophora brassicae]|uniref:Uncharacterized protein n=1 Tax=Plasmodiophora brassicae TaxID=37360 RepID=A0A3P3YLI5_PLABS|nr:unnamed protein product [Plasmodiophora brassicae]